MVPKKDAVCHEKNIYERNGILRSIRRYMCVRLSQSACDIQSYDISEPSLFFVQVIALANVS
jgi:hypothetical protein